VKNVKKKIKKRVIISVTNDLVSDNRVHKVAVTLTTNGFDVLLVGRKLKNSQNIERSYNTKRFRLIFKRSALFYAEYNFRLFLFLLFSKADIFLSNDLDSLAANYYVAKICNKKLVYDSHELFTEVPELVNRPIIKKIWESIEKRILPKITHSYTVCQSIADFYNKKYGIDMKVVINVPFLGRSEFVKEQRSNKILIYQGAVNIGRGLEEIIEAMQFLEGYELWIVGIGDIYNDLIEKVKKLNLTPKVRFLGRKTIDELPKITAQADLGLSIEKNLGLNYYYALPNKIFDYIQAGVPVLCSDLPEMRKIVETYGVGEILGSHEPMKLAEQINSIFADEHKIETYKKNQLSAKNILCWENEEKILMEVFEN
jgi:glycosyltransferase involved in cell wall biosynthesis